MQQVLDRICCSVGAEQDFRLVGLQNEVGLMFGLFSTCGETAALEIGSERGI